jgi:hypothetical protein
MKSTFSIKKAKTRGFFIVSHKHLIKTVWTGSKFISWEKAKSNNNLIEFYPTLKAAENELDRITEKTPKKLRRKPFWLKK